MVKIVVGSQIPEQLLAHGGRKVHQLDREPIG